MFDGERVTLYELEKRALQNTSPELRKKVDRAIDDLKRQREVSCEELYRPMDI